MAVRCAKLAKDNIKKTKSSAIAAVTIFNTPGLEFRIPLYLVLIIISWTSFFHAYFYKKKLKPWYKKKANNKKYTRYEKIDGEPKHWELLYCLKKYFGNNQPSVRKNLEFIIGLRNKIEHRHLPEIEPSVIGECQSALLNLENSIIQEFGKNNSIAKKLSISLQFSYIRPEEHKKAIKKLLTSDGKDILSYIDNFRKELSEKILNDQDYSYNILLIPKVVGSASSSDVAVEFISTKDLTEEEIERYKKLNVLIRDKSIPIVNSDKFLPSVVVKKVNDKIPFKFNIHLHTACWRYFNVRPGSYESDKSKTKSQYCYYNETHNDYVYTESWVMFLIDQLSDNNKFEQITNTTPIEK